MTCPFCHKHHDEEYDSDICNVCGEVMTDIDSYEDYMDGDLASGLASAGFGTNEDYGDFFENSCEEW